MMPAAQRARDYGYGYGSLLPLALNFSPNGVSGPPPAGAVWHAPQDLPVSLANWTVAPAGAEMARTSTVVVVIAAPMPVATESIVVELIFMGKFPLGAQRSVSAKRPVA